MSLTGTAAGEKPAVTGDRDWGAPERSAHTGFLIAGMVAIVLLPLLIAVAVLRDPAWMPMTDMVQIEMRVRDVGLDHPPLVGLGGRIEGYGENGNHPGPLAFYALAPIYRLAGADGWGFQVASATLSALAAGLAIWVGHRRGGWPFALATTAGLLLLLRGYGIDRLVDGWNPHLPLVWWFLFLLAVWSVLCRDHAMLPVAVFAGSLCAQTHVPYTGPVMALGVLTAAVLVTRVLTWRGGAAATPRRRALLGWVALSGALLALLWLPPLIEEVRNDPGNMTIIVESLRNPEFERLAFADAWRAWLGHLDVGQLVHADVDPIDLHPGGSSWSGAVLLGAWVVAAAAAWHRRDPGLVRLHVVVGAALALGLVAISRISGVPFPYLMLWAWGTAVLALLATVWTVLLVRHPAADGAPAAGEVRAPVSMPALRSPGPALALLGTATLVLGGVFGADAASAEMRDATLSGALRELVAATVARLEEDPAGCGDDCRYQVTWTDPLYLGGQGEGMLMALERQGFRVGAQEGYILSVRDHRVVSPDEVDAVIHVAVTDAVIADARAQRGAEELAYVDPYTASEKAEQRQLERDAAAALDAEGFPELADQVRRDDPSQELIPFYFVEGMSTELQGMLRRLNEIVRPSAVFLLPPGTQTAIDA